MIVEVTLWWRQVHIRTDDYGYSERRDRWFESHGFTVLHFESIDYVYKYLPEVMETIKAALDARA